MSGEARADWSSATIPPDLVAVPELSVFVLRHILIVLVAVAISVGGALAYVKLATPTYTARTQLLIDPKSSQLTRDEAQSSTIDSAQLESQMAVLRSERIAVAVIRQLGLLKNPAFVKPQTEELPEGALLQQAVSAFGAGLDVRRSGLSYVIDLTFTSPDAKLAAQVANATADAYIHDQLDSRATSARVGSEWLERRVAQLREQMSTAALALQEFKAGRAYRGYRDEQRGDAGADGSAQVQGGTRDRNTLEELESTAQAYKKIYESALQGYAEAVQRQSNPMVETRVLSPATTPLNKSHPRSTLIVAFGVLLGGLLGVGLAILRENLDSTIRSVRSAKQQLGLLCLGALPLIRRTSRTRWSVRRSFGRRLGALLALLKRRYGKPSLECFTATDELGKDPFLHALAQVSTTLAATERRRSLRAIGITSAIGGEGKTTIAGNLACLLAASGVRVLVIDADLERCAMTQAVTTAGQPGLVQILLEDCPVSECSIPVPRTGVELLPTKKFNSVISEALLGSSAMMRCLSEALSTYDLVLVDLPALDQNSGAIAMGPLLDGLLIAVEWGRTPAPLVIDAVERLQSTGSHLLGTILNKAS
ncbi:AAA family ATPase [Chelatococcus reniformis]|uniref:AAA family ATPase n=1 Tax=Chelatococcus reniformis TaxID=1494448 RepID=UPI001662EE7D|nr:AAA family ATPase [Chelatococcus reniformis]